MTEDRLIVALDYPGMSKILHLSEQLRDHVGWVKVGLEPFIRNGPTLVRELRDMGFKVMLDVKAHDIPRTVVAATRQAIAIGANMMTVHASCSKGAIKQAVRYCGPFGGTPLLQIAAVTVLTSTEERAGTAKRVYDLADKALSVGAHGVVCSAKELKTLDKLGGIRIVPGIRRATDDVGDQKRIATPKEAIANGATHIVVGRPITQAANPLDEAKAIIEEINS